MTENWFATFALLSWIMVALWLYSSRPIGQATVWTILAGQLLLPVGALIKIAPGIPQLDKASIPNLAALIGCILASRKVRLWHGLGVVEALLIISVFSPFVTSELNGDVVSMGGMTLPSVGHYDALSAVVAQFLLLLPFFLGRQFLRGSADNQAILRSLATAGLLYSPLVLFEIRMSPQLHYWVYGYFPSDFLQQMREGGFRAAVFMGHGLAVSFFLMTTVIASAALWRTNIRIKNLSPSGVTTYLFGVLVLNKSLGSIVYALTLGPLVRYAGLRWQARVAVSLVFIALLYPAARIMDVFPTNTLVETAALVDPERADSLQFRFDNEGRLLSRAKERFLFGWGRFGRNRVYDEYGKDISVTDGRWIITLGQFGFIGFLAEFGLLAFSVFAAARALKFASSQSEGLFLMTLALIVAVSVVDLLPNAGLTPWTWLLAGALVGRAESMRARLLEGQELSVDSSDRGHSKNEREREVSVSTRHIWE